MQKHCKKEANHKTAKLQKGNNTPINMQYNTKMQQMRNMQNMKMQKCKN